MNEDAYAMISALQHFLFCPRQAALIHLEDQWVDNRLTVAGDHLHRNVDVSGLSFREGTRYCYALPLVSHRLCLRGRADVVAFPADDPPVPVEYKHGKQGRWKHNQVQLCAQAIALEDMMNLKIAFGFIYFHASRSRHRVEFDPALREQTHSAAAAFHRLLESGRTPAAVAEPKCRSCSLKPVCLPELCHGGPLPTLDWKDRL